MKQSPPQHQSRGHHLDGGKVSRVGGTGYARSPPSLREPPRVATAPNGWNAIVVGAQVSWVSGKYQDHLMRCRLHLAGAAALQSCTIVGPNNLTILWMVRGFMPIKDVLNMGRPEKQLIEGVRFQPLFAYRQEVWFVNTQQKERIAKVRIGEGCCQCEA